MKRDQLEHVIHAAAEVSEEREIVVVGSQAILGEFPDAPEPLLLSQEADIYPRRRPEKAIEIDGALGDGSPFHETYGYYAHGVGPETAKAPAGWEQRLIEVRIPPRRGGASEAIAWCMEAHDVVLAKCVAGRNRDWDFAEEAIRQGIVEPGELLARVPDLPIDGGGRERVQEILRGVVARAQRSR